MVFCIIALVVFAALGLFSAKYRPLAREAFDCVFRTMTLRKCTTNFDKKMQVRISSKVAQKSEKAGRFVYRAFPVLSFIFVIAMFASLVYGAWGAYNWVAFGNCNGPGSDGECVYNDLLGTPGGTGGTDAWECDQGGPVNDLIPDADQNADGGA